MVHVGALEAYPARAASSTAASILPMYVSILVRHTMS